MLIRHPEQDWHSFMAEFFTTPAILVFLLKELESGTGNRFLVEAKSKRNKGKYVDTRKD
jgi:hypothetical protein